MREKARQLRREEELTIDEIAERLGVSRTTVYFWVGDMPRPARCRSRIGQGHALGNAAMQAKYRRLREDAYGEGRASFESMAREDGFIDFVTLFIAEGYKRNRNVVSVSNSDPAVIVIADRWLRRLSKNKLTYWSSTTPIRICRHFSDSGRHWSEFHTTRSDCNGSPTAIS